jgi:hypothetical protein
MIALTYIQTIFFGQFEKFVKFHVLVIFFFLITCKFILFFYAALSASLSGRLYKIDSLLGMFNPQK